MRLTIAPGVTVTLSTAQHQALVWLGAEPQARTVRDARGRGVEGAPSCRTLRPLVSMGLVAGHKDLLSGTMTAELTDLGHHTLKAAARWVAMRQGRFV
jgi:hypothetical protein